MSEHEAKDGDDAYWMGQFDRGRDLLDRFVQRAIETEKIEPEALSMLRHGEASELRP
jgi:hypothetical protein